MMARRLRHSGPPSAHFPAAKEGTPWISRSAESSSHTIAARESGEKTVILFNLSGHGIFDLGAYDAFLEGRMALQA